MTAGEQKKRVTKVKERKQKKERIAAEINKKKTELSRLANSLFDPVGKNPYYLNRGSSSIAIKNMAELRDNLEMFTRDEALWLAAWIEYLGDEETAARIRETPDEFAAIITERHEELQEFFSPGNRAIDRRK